MRKELMVFIETTSIDKDELLISTTQIDNAVVLTLPNGAKVGVKVDELMDALYEVKTFKKLNPTKDEVNLVAESSHITWVSDN
jgi:hypothetical protein